MTLTAQPNPGHNWGHETPEPEWEDEVPEMAAKNKVKVPDTVELTTWFVVRGDDYEPIRLTAEWYDLGEQEELNFYVGNKLVHTVSPRIWENVLVAEG